MRLGITILFLVGTILQVNSQTLSSQWEGKWEGEVEIWAFNKVIESFPMSLEISPKDSSWDFILTYNRSVETPDVRKYSLIIVEDSAGHFAIDEHNSIVLDTYLNRDCLYTSFGGLGSELQTRLCLKSNQIEYEITSVNSDPIRVSGDEVLDGDSIPEIKSYQVYHVMRAELTKG